MNEQEQADFDRGLDEYQAGPFEVICMGCKKPPEEIREYSKEMTGSSLDPYNYVRMNEGTYNNRNGHFLCTDCYIKAGMPSSDHGWKCP